MFLPSPKYKYNLLGSARAAINNLITKYPEYKTDNLIEVLRDINKEMELLESVFEKERQDAEIKKVILSENELNLYNKWKATGNPVSHLAKEFGLTENRANRVIDRQRKQEIDERIREKNNGTKSYNNNILE